MSIRTNLAAQSISRHLAEASTRIDRGLHRVASGLRIASASDDAAGLSISEKTRSLVRGYAQSLRNGQDAQSLINVAEGGLASIQETMQRMRELAVQASNDTLSEPDRDALQGELDELMQGLYDVSQNTEFNGIPLLQNDAVLVFQVGPDAGDAFDLDLYQVDQNSLGISGLLLTPREEAEDAIRALDLAASEVSTFRSYYGATYNRLGHVINNASNAQLNQQAARSRIVDADLAKEVMSLQKDQIISQSGIAMMAQANSSATQVLKLLRS